MTDRLPASATGQERVEYWFPAKRYGWGWGPPRTWQGWVVIVVWFTVFFGGVLALAPNAHPLKFSAFVGAMVVALILVCYWKGEPPRWRWGK